MTEPSCNRAVARWGPALLVAAVIASSLGGMLVARVEPAAADDVSRPVFEEFLWNGEIPNTITTRIAMTKFDPRGTQDSALAFGIDHGSCEIRQRAGAAPPPGGFPLFVYDLVDGEDALKRPKFWPAGGCGELAIDMSADGLVVVAEVSSNMATVDTTSCPSPGWSPTNGTYYDKQQIVSWRRDAVGEPFDDPILVSKAEVQPAGCDASVTPDPGGPPAPSALIGAGGNGYSYQPAINDLGTRVVFASAAPDLGPDLSSTSTRALFVAGTDGGNLEMVTPAAFDGEVFHPQISSDGETVVFESDDTGLDPRVTAEGPMQVYIAHRVSEGGWDIELVSEKDGLPLTGRSESPQLAPEGDRVIYKTSSVDIEDGRTLSGGDSLVARDMGATTSENLVFVTPDDRDCRARRGQWVVRRRLPSEGS